VEPSREGVHAAMIQGDPTKIPRLVKYLLDVITWAGILFLFWSAISNQPAPPAI
jgi:hypothetical protein